MSFFSSHYVVARSVLGVCLVLLWCSGTAFCQRPKQAGLPSESELPGGRQPTDILPSESTLPGDQPNRSSDLPGEDQIPGDPPRDDGALNTPIAGQVPILRLAFDGHTGRVRTLDTSDGGRTLVSAGDDKEVHVWRRSDIAASGWLHRRTIRWPVTRGPRGRVYAARLKGDLVAFAGHGAFGYLGEIRVVDAANGDLKDVLADTRPGQGHRQNVISLCWSPGDDSTLASIDMDGRLIVWSADAASGIQQGRTLIDVDDRTYNAEIARILKTDQRRAFAPVSFVGPNYVTVPRFVGPLESDKSVANWHLQRVDVRTGESVMLENLDHIKHVRCLSATDDGMVLTSCDWGGSVGVWRFNADGAVIESKNFKPQKPPIFVDVDPSGSLLLVGTEIARKAVEGDNLASIELWDIEATPAKMLSRRPVESNAMAGVLDSKRREVMIAQGSHIEIHSYDARFAFSKSSSQQLVVPAKPVLKVAFDRDPDSKKIAFGWNRNEAGEKLLEGVFDLAECKLLGRGPVDPEQFLPAQRTAVRWQVGGPHSTDAGPRFRVFENGEPRGMLPLRIDRNGAPTAVCTLPPPGTGSEEPGEIPGTGAIVVGTAGHNNIYVYQADASNPPKLLRQFRDHSGGITSLSSSADGNYLVSSGNDSTISIWNLQDMYTSSQSINRWGIEFELEESGLIVSKARVDGPLYFRGVREDDRLVSLNWVDHQAKPFAESDPVKMQERLLSLPFDQMVQFTFARRGRAGPMFQSFPAWRPIATLFVDQNREWAFWTPSGYYDASFNGHQRFGWQINNDFGDAVAYFRAAQFRKQLERPDVMRRLLAAGSLSAAMRQTVSQIGPPPAESAIVNQILNKPSIRVLSPAAGDTIEGDDLTVAAEIEVPLGATLIDPKAFVSGVPAIDRQVVGNHAETRPRVVTYQWKFRLPSDRQLQLEVLAATEAEAVDRVRLDLDHVPSNLPRPKPRLHVLAIGASEYRDPQIQSLDFAAKAVGDISDLFRRNSATLYQTTADQLVNSDATRPLWRVFAKSATARLSETVSPDDLVVMYLCGHGLRDRQTNQWYFVTAEARYNDLMNDQYDDCIAFSDLAELAKLPCRKLAILDSCHSGAVQPLMRSEDLKSALRFLQDDVVLTLTASEGDEEAAEQRASKLGRFTSVLIDALSGKADAADNQSEGIVTLSETIRYVTRRVSEESERDGMPQHPTASPSYLLKTLHLPLTAIESR